MSKPPPISLSPKDRAVLKLVLEGQSAIDRGRLFFSSEQEVRDFLKVNEFDLSRPRDTDRLMSIHNEAVGYLRRELKIDLGDAFKNPGKLIRFFLMAGDPSDPVLQKQACSLLKVMNIINHIDGREFLSHCPISLRDLFSLVEDKIERSLSALSRQNLIASYQGGRKPKESLITKLLCKKETIAAQIYDRVRYRIVTPRREDIVAVVAHLFSTILPFNYVIPSASTNQLVTLDRTDRLRLFARTLKNQLPHSAEEREYSGRDYRVCKFVVDIPVRMDNFLASSAASFHRASLGSIAYVLVEFQIVDEKAERDNNTGNNSHELYKKRQKTGVIRRLMG